MILKQRKKIFKDLETSLIFELQRQVKGSHGEVNHVTQNNSTRISSTEEQIEALIFQIGYNIREKFKNRRFFHFYFFVFSQMPAIFLNFLKLLFNLLNSTLIHPVFDIPEDAQTLASIGRLKIRIFTRDHPPPHFHVVTENFNVKFAIETGEILSKPPHYFCIRRRELKVIQKWQCENKEKLKRTWNLLHDQ